MRIAVLLIALVALTVNAQDKSAPEDVTFSKHSPALNFFSYDPDTTTHLFVGTISLNGTLYLQFDMAASDRANGEINFTKFVPDPEFVSLLPAVVKGFHPSPVQYVNLKAPFDQIVALFGGREEYARISHGTLHEVSKRATVVLRDYSATVECDSRSYGAHAQSVGPIVKARRLATNEVPHGC